MHLFALLIAAVFSSNFVAPNTFASFTTTLKSITTTQLEGTLPEFTVTLNAAPSELPTGFVSLVVTGYTTEIVELETLVLVSGTTYTVPATDISDLDADAATQASIFIHLEDTGMSGSPVNVEVPVAEAWTIAAAADFLDIQLPATPVFTITATHVLGWADNDAEFRFKRGDDAPVVATLPLDGDGTADYTIASGDLSGLGILTADFADGPINLEVAIKFGANDYYAKTASLELKRSEPSFTTREVLTKEEVNASTTFTFTPKTDGAWDGKTVTVVFTKTKVQPGDHTSGKFAAVTKPADAWGCTIDMTGWNLVAAVTEFYAYIHLDDGQASNAAAFLPTPATIVYDDEDPISGTVGLNPNTAAWVTRADIADITVTVTGQDATDLTADATYKIIYTDASQQDHELVGDLAENAGVYKIVDLDLTDFALPNAATTLKVWIYPTGTAKSYPEAANFAITKSDAEFSVTPDPVTSATTIARLEITATDGTDWADAGIAAQLEYPDKTAIPLELALDDTRSNAAKVFFVENVAIGPFAVANNTKITVKAAKAKPASGPAAFLPVPVEITVTLPTPPAEETFTITPATMVWSATLETPEVIVVAPSKSVSWTEPKAIFTYTPAGDALSNNPKTAEVDLVFVDPDWTIPEGSDLSDLAITEPAEDEEVEVVVTIHTGTKLLAHPETFTITKSAPTPPPAFEFTLTLTTITDEAMKANLGEMTVSPKTGVTFTATAAAKGVFSATAPTAAAQAHADGVQVDLAVVPINGTTPAKYKMAADTYKLEDLIPATLPGKIYFYLKEDGDGAWSIFGAPIDVTKAGSAAMGVSPLVSLLVALVFLFVKLF